METSEMVSESDQHVTGNDSNEQESSVRSCISDSDLDANINNNHGCHNNNKGTAVIDVRCVSASQNHELKNGSCVVPGVEHVFFEEELEKLEHHILETGNVVVMAVDGSQPSEEAFQFYVSNINRPGFVLHVVHHSSYSPGNQLGEEAASPKHCQDMIQREDSQVLQIEDRYRHLIAANQVVGDFIVLRGKETWHEIIEYQERVRGIMIILGTRGQNSLRRTLMGSVSDSVVHHASCPVLICGHTKHGA